MLLYNYPYTIILVNPNVPHDKITRNIKSFNDYNNYNDNFA